MATSTKEKPAKAAKDTTPKEAAPRGGPRAHTQELDAAVLGALYAESLMNLRPWDLWTRDGKPQPETPEILRTIEAVQKLDPTHPLANHLYIHAVEASPEPGKAGSQPDGSPLRWVKIGLCE